MGFTDPTKTGITDSDQSRGRQALDLLVGFRAFAAGGALLAAVAPAIMATAGGHTLRGSVSAYYNVDPSYYFWGPFGLAAVLLFVDGIASYLSPNKNRYGRRWYNMVLAVALLLLTVFDLDTNKNLHYFGAYVFFLGFIFVICYTSVLGVRGTLTKKAQDDLVEDRPIDSVMSQLSIAFIGLVVLTIVGWLAGLVSFFFFEVFALLNFALYYVQTLIHPFPYNDYEFKSPMVNSICRFLQLMASDRS